MIRFGADWRLPLITVAGIALFPAIVGGAIGYGFAGRSGVVYGGIVASLVAIVVALLLPAR